MLQLETLDCALSEGPSLSFMAPSPGYDSILFISDIS